MKPNTTTAHSHNTNIMTTTLIALSSLLIHSSPGLSEECITTQAGTVSDGPQFPEQREMTPMSSGREANIT